MSEINSRKPLSKKSRGLLIGLASVAIFAASSTPALADGGGGGGGTGITAVENMVTDLDGVADDAMPIAVAVTGFAVAVLLVKRALYA